jgi:hypothetical protein
LKKLFIKYEEKEKKKKEEESKKKLIYSLKNILIKLYQKIVF